MQIQPTGSLAYRSIVTYPILPIKDKPVRHVIPQDDYELGNWSIEIVQRELTISGLCKEFPNADPTDLDCMLMNLEDYASENSDVFIITRNGLFMSFIIGHRNPENSKEFFIDTFYGIGVFNQSEYLVQFIKFTVAFKGLLQIELLKAKLSFYEHVRFMEYREGCRVADAELVVRYINNENSEDDVHDLIITIDPSREFKGRAIPEVSPDMEHDEFEFECFYCCSAHMPFDLVFERIQEFHRHFDAFPFSFNKMLPFDETKHKSIGRKQCEIIDNHPQLETASDAQILALLNFYEYAPFKEKLLNILAERVRSKRLEIVSLSPSDFRIMLFYAINSNNYYLCSILMESVRFTGLSENISFYIFLKAVLTTGNYPAYDHLTKQPQFKNLSIDWLTYIIEKIEGNPNVVDQHWIIALNPIKARIREIESAKKQTQFEFPPFLHF